MRIVFMTSVIVAAPRLALACPVCFGQSDSPMASAANTGILVMLGIVGCVLAGFGAFIAHLARRASRFAAASGVEHTGYGLERTEPQEGTARC